jgi:hypothetical protein
MFPNSRTRKMMNIIYKSAIVHFVRFGFAEACCIFGGCGRAFKNNSLLPKNFSHPTAWLIAGKEGRTLREHDHRIGYPTVLIDIVEESALMQRPCSVNASAASSE